MSPGSSARYFSVSGRAFKHNFCFLMCQSVQLVKMIEICSITVKWWCGFKGTGSQDLQPKKLNKTLYTGMGWWDSNKSGWNGFTNGQLNRRYSMAKVNICLVDYLDMMLIAEQKDMVGKNVVRPLTDFKVIIRRNHVFGLAFIPNSNIVTATKYSISA